MKNLKKRLFAFAAVAVFGVASVSPFVVEAQDNTDGGSDLPSIDNPDEPQEATRGRDVSEISFDGDGGEPEITKKRCKWSIKRACYTKMN